MIAFLSRRMWPCRRSFEFFSLKCQRFAAADLARSVLKPFVVTSTPYPPASAAEMPICGVQAVRALNFGVRGQDRACASRPDATAKVPRPLPQDGLNTGQ